MVAEFIYVGGRREADDQHRCVLQNSAPCLPVRACERPWWRSLGRRGTPPFWRHLPAAPQQMNEGDVQRAGANLIVTPTESTNADGKAGDDKAMVQHTTEMVKAKVPRNTPPTLRERARQRLRRT